MERVFIDTGFLIALETRDDQHHKAAQDSWRSMLALSPSFFTTEYIVNEVATFFNSRNRHKKAVEIGNCLLNSPSVHFIHVDRPLFLKGWDYFGSHEDKSYSLTDCISFVVMETFEVKCALTFDRHFEQAGFRRIPNPMGI